MPDDDITLTNPNGAKPRYARIVQDGTGLTRETWTGIGKRRVTVKEFADDHQARWGFDKETRTRMRQGFVYLRDVTDTPPGGLVMQCAVPGVGLGYGFDLHPDGTTLATGFGSDGNGTAEMHLVDVATGVRTLVHTDLSVPGRNQPWLFDVLFDSTGGLVSTLNGETRRLDLATGTSHVIAAYSEPPTVGKTSRFSPHRVHPSQDASRRRLLVFDANDTVRVLDTDGRTILELSLADREECRAGALSPSGRLLALTFGMNIGVWEVDTGRKLIDTPFPDPFGPNRSEITKIGFDTTESLLTATGNYVEGPFVWRLDSQHLRYIATDPHRTDHFGTCYTWAYSPDGRLLAVDEGGVVFLNAETFDKLPTEELPTERYFVAGTKRITFSADSRLVAIGGGRLSVYRAPAD